MCKIQLALTSELSEDSNSMIQNKYFLRMVFKGGEKRELTIALKICGYVTASAFKSSVVCLCFPYLQHRLLHSMSWANDSFKMTELNSWRVSKHPGQP